MLSHWQGTVSAQSEKSCVRIPIQVFFFVIVHSYSILWEHDILDPHSAACLDLNNQSKSSTGVIKRRQYHGWKIIKISADNTYTWTASELIHKVCTKGFTIYKMFFKDVLYKYTSLFSDAFVVEHDSALIYAHSLISSCTMRMYYYVKL